jgi:Capsule polysaccharide biosynthesis protein
MTDAAFLVDDGTGPREVRLDSYLDQTSEERATFLALSWIKSLRRAQVDGLPLRRRFTLRGDSLWWFAELYFHKQQVILQLFRTLAALEALVDRERPLELRFVRGGYIVKGLAPQVADARKVRYRGPRGFGRSSALRLAAMKTRASSLNAAALASRLRTRAALAPPHPIQVAAFVHRAFWRSDSGDGSAEAYIGPVLNALEHRAGEGAIAYVSVGPASNFRARRWWHPLQGGARESVACPIEAYAPLTKLKASRRIWRERHAMRRALWKSSDLRELAVIRGYDCWPIVRHELAGVALLQWPWSARAMDEAGAVLDTLQPRAALTYAEAGGWGRAIMLECRRRGVHSVGLQHGFIYRHWLNYLHEPDEMSGDPELPSDRGFPRPDLTLLYDDYAARHLAEAGRFPPEGLLVTGSPRLDALVKQASGLTTADIDRARTEAGAASRTLVLVATKHKEARHALVALADAAEHLPDVHLAIKTHPAETPDVYADLVARGASISVLDASAPLAPLLRASRVVVTVNSTVALDAALLDVPALVIGQPNNLTPFVDAGVMAGTPDGDIALALRRILYDEEFRRALGLARRAFLTRFGILADGRAAERAADAVLTLAGRRAAAGTS